jgi:acetoacetyl-CoA reductase
VVLTGRSAAGLKTVTADLAAAGADVSFIPADLTQPGAAEALVQAVEDQRGGIGLLVNNAGGDPLREFHTMTIEENLRTLRLNLIAPGNTDPRGPGTVWPRSRRSLTGPASVTAAGRHRAGHADVHRFTLTPGR